MRCKKKSLGPKAEKVSGGISLEFTMFWSSVRDDVAHLAKLAKNIYTV